MKHLKLFGWSLLASLLVGLVHWTSHSLFKLSVMWVGIVIVVTTLISTYVILRVKKK